MSQPPKPSQPLTPAHPTAPAPAPGAPANPSDPAAPAHPEGSAPVDLQAQRDKEAVEASLHPKDFKLAQPGSKDYVAGQPVDEKELGEVTAAAEKRMEAGHSKTSGGTAQEKTVQQYGPEGAGEKC